MSDGIFENGNRRITRLVVYQLGLASLALVLIQVQGFLPSLDFLTPKQLKITSFSLAVALSLIRAGEMFFNKTATLFKTGELRNGDTEIKAITETKP